MNGSGSGRRRDDLARAGPQLRQPADVAHLTALRRRSDLGRIGPQPDDACANALRGARI